MNLLHFSDHPFKLKWGEAMLFFVVRIFKASSACRIFQRQTFFPSRSLTENFWSSTPTHTLPTKWMVPNYKEQISVPMVAFIMMIFKLLINTFWTRSTIATIYLWPFEWWVFNISIVCFNSLSVLVANILKMQKLQLFKPKL